MRVHTVAPTSVHTRTTPVPTPGRPIEKPLTDHAIDRAKDLVDEVRTTVDEAALSRDDGDGDRAGSWRWLAIGVGAFTGVALGVRTWRRRRDATSVHRFETVDDGATYRSGGDLTRWQLPSDAFDDGSTDDGSTDRGATDDG